MAVKLLLNSVKENAFLLIFPLIKHLLKVLSLKYNGKNKNPSEKLNKPKDHSPVYIGKCCTVSLALPTLVYLAGFRNKQKPLIL